VNQGALFLMLLGGIVVVARSLRMPIDVARANLGVQSVGAPFHGPPERFNLPGEQPAPWCARFVRFCFESAGKRLPGNRFLIPSVANLQAALESAGMWHPAGEDGFVPQQNDLLLLQGTGNGEDGLEFGGHHVALVESFDGTHVVTIDGDFFRPDRVARVSRAFGQIDIWGYGRIP
jgi:hypothetical protein